MNETREFKDLTVKHLGFLVDEFGLVYDESRNQFDHPSIRISVEEYDSRLPTISVWFKSEPKFTSLGLDRLLEEFIDYEAMDKLLIEGCFDYFASVLRKHLAELMKRSESFLLKAMKKILIDELKSQNFTKSNYLAGLTEWNRKEYYYIKKKDRGWHPGKAL